MTTPYDLPADLGPPIASGRDFDVFRAVVDGTTCAVKVQRRDSPEPPEQARARLARELEALSRVTASGPLPPGTAVPAPLGLAESADGRPALVRAWVEGESLATLTARALVRHRWQGARRWNEATRALTRAIAEALSAVHRAGLAHNDLKPEDVIVRWDGEHFTATLLDLGLAAPPGRGGPGGTVRWAAPERLEGAPGTPKSDLWAFGALLYELLCGLPPYPEDQPVDARLARRDPVDQPRREANLRAWRSLEAYTAPAPLQPALRALLHPDPRQRPADVPAALRLLGLGRGPTTRASVIHKTPRGRSWLAPALAVVGVGAALGLGLGPVGRALGLTGHAPSDPLACQVLAERAAALCAGTSDPARCEAALTDTSRCRERATLLGSCGGP